MNVAARTTATEMHTATTVYISVVVYPRIHATPIPAAVESSAPTGSTAATGPDSTNRFTIAARTKRGVDRPERADARPLVDTVRNDHDYSDTLWDFIEAQPAWLSHGLTHPSQH